MDPQTFLDNFVESIDGLEADGLTIETRLADVPVWDSLAILNTIAMVDAEYEVTVSGRELNACAAIADILKLVETRKAGA